MSGSWRASQPQGWPVRAAYHVLKAAPPTGPMVRAIVSPTPRSSGVATRAIVLAQSGHLSREASATTPRKRALEEALATLRRSLYDQTMLPVIRGIIDRRMLLNYRVMPEVVAKLLPRPFQAKLVGDCAIVGICLIRLRSIRPRGVPEFLGITSENAAHRFAVEWNEKGVRREGVYIPRRDTSSRLNSMLGGRLFPGVHHHARFQVHEANNRFELSMRSDDGEARLSVRVSTASDLPATSRFDTLAQASEFFERGSVGYSASTDQRHFDGLELRTERWKVEPLAIEHVESSYFENLDLFPPGTTEFDCALLMRDIRHEWHSRESLCYC